ncbi:MAG: nucleotide pyrophosphohydrolase [Hyphomicrobiales bacterium]|nr:nucleotide pyrophosphohydrolase [Hyphomicrobiales bacterium]MCP5000984.1 nucleotide pyrophosphohydrolase [Hyphomicrobiales bacterium]
MDGDHATLETLTRRLIEFRDARDWQQYHSIKNLIISLNLEAAELMELTQWKSAEAVESDIKTEPGRARIAEECADVFLYLLLIAERAGLNLTEIAQAKIALNEEKYPVEKARGNVVKYTDL